MYLNPRNALAWICLTACTPKTGSTPLGEDSDTPAEVDTPADTDSEETGPDSGQASDSGTDTSTPPAKRPMLLAVMVDGWRPDVIPAAETPTIDGWLAGAAYSLEARVDDTTISGSGQTSFVTGVQRDKHQVPDNSFSKPNLSAYPHFFVRLKEHNSALKTAAYQTWEPLSESVVAGADIHRFHDYEDGGDAAMVAALIADLATEDSDAIVLMLSDLDIAGHTHTFDPQVAEYVAEMEDIDTQLGQIQAAIQARESIAGEDWMVIVSTDHGGTSYSHGQNIPEHRQVPLLITGGDAVAGTIWPPPANVDIAVTAMKHLGVDANPTWDMDGDVVGLAASAPPVAALSVNLITNGDAELERGYTDFSPDASVPAWTDTGYATVMQYGSPDGFPTSTDPGPADRGSNFFCGGGTTDDTTLTQRIDVSALADDIDTGTLAYALSGWLGGYASQDDRSQLTAAFLDGDGNTVHEARLSAMTAADRGEQTGLWEQRADGTVPAGVRAVEVTLTALRASGYNDGYADNLSLVLSAP